MINAGLVKHLKDHLIHRPLSSKEFFINVRILRRIYSYEIPTVFKFCTNLIDNVFSAKLQELLHRLDKVTF